MDNNGVEYSAVKNGSNGAGYVVGEKNEFFFKTPFYGRDMIRIVQVERIGSFHIIKEYKIDLKLSLEDVKEYKTTDISNIICAEACKDTLYILANNHGIKNPEEFAILACKHFFGLYNSMIMIRMDIEDFSWSRITDDDEKSVIGEEARLHHHAFIHRPDYVRTSVITMYRKDMKPIIESGIKELRMIKTGQATLVRFTQDAYRTLKDIHQRVLCTDVTCTWRYKTDANDIDYDALWNRVKNCIIKSWGGDLEKGVLSPCIQHTLHSTEKNILESVPEIDSVYARFLNLPYLEFDFTSFEGLTTDPGNRKIYMPVEKPFGLSDATMTRRDHHDSA